MMRYIHGKDWDAKMLEALVAERMKPKIHAAIPSPKFLSSERQTLQPG